MDDSTREMRLRFADCLRRFLSGKVTCDHVIEEFGSSGDDQIREIMDLVREETKGLDRYKKFEHLKSEFGGRMEEIIARLEGR